MLLHVKQLFPETRILGDKEERILAFYFILIVLFVLNVGCFQSSHFILI